MRQFLCNLVEKVALIFVKQYAKIKVLIKFNFLSLTVDIIWDLLSNTVRVVNIILQYDYLLNASKIETCFMPIFPHKVVKI